MKPPYKSVAGTLKIFGVLTLLFSTLILGGCAGGGFTEPRIKRPGSSPDYIDRTTGMEFSRVRGGCFKMGDLFRDGYGDAVKPYPVHEVCLDDYYIGRFEVSQWEWENVMHENPSRHRISPEHPVERVSWNDAQRFITKLNKRSKVRYRLPTEAEWEYACRERGKKIRFGMGRNKISSDDANYDGKSMLQSMSTMKPGIWRKKTVRVDYFSPNSLGLYNMSGNVWEWTNDYFSDRYYQVSPKYNPKGPRTGKERLVRGGGYGYNVDYLRCAFRGKHYNPEHTSTLFGLRLVWSKKNK